MATYSQSRCVILTMCVSLAMAPAKADSVQPHLAMTPAPAESASQCLQPASQVGPSTAPLRIHDPNCATVTLASSFTGVVTGTASTPADPPSSEPASSGELLDSLWWFSLGLGMLILAGINSRKRHRQVYAKPAAAGTRAPTAKVRVS